MKYLKNTITVEALKLSLFEDDNKGTKFFDSNGSFLLL